MPQPRPFSKILRKLREASEISQDELAHRAGLHRTYIGLLERGKRIPTIDTLFTIAKALKIRPSQIIAKMER